VVLSVQDIRYDQMNTAKNKIREKYVELTGNVDLWICDERHFQYEGDVTSAKFENINATYTLDLTATPYEIMDQYDPDQCILRGLPWAVRNTHYTKIPSIKMETFNTPFCNVSPVLKDIYSIEEGFSPQKLFAMQEGNFVHSLELHRIVELCYNTNQSKFKNSMSITNDTSLSDVAKRNGMWVLPIGAGEISADYYIPLLAKTLNSYQTHTVFISSYEISDQCPKYITTGDFIQGLLDDNIGKNVIILTCRKFTTGTDIPSLGHLVMFDKIESLCGFEQLLGRLIRIYKGKDRVKVYSLTPGYNLQIMIGRLAKADGSNGEQILSFLDMISFTDFDVDGSRRDVNSIQILEYTQEWCEKQVKNGKLPDVQLKKVVSSFDINEFAKLELVNSGNKKCTHEVSDSNGSKSKIITRINGNIPTPKEVANLELNIKDTIQSLIGDSRVVCYYTKCYDYRKVFKNEDLIAIYGKEVIDAILKAAKNSREFKKMLNKDFKEKKNAYSSLTERQIYPLLFDNSEFKQRKGLVYTDFALADELVSNISGAKDKSIILVINALNGSIPLALREQYPDSKIICVEIFDYHKQYLKSLGFEVVDYKDLCNIEKDFKMQGKEFHVAIGNPPYQDGTKDGGQNKIYTFICKKLLEILSPDGSITLVTPESLLKNSSRYSIIGEHGLKLVNYNVNKYFNVGVGICSWTIDRTYTGDVKVMYDDVIDYQPQNNAIVKYSKVDKDFVTLYYKLKELTDKPSKRMFCQNNFGKSSVKVKDAVHTNALYKLNKGVPLLTYYTKNTPYFFGELKFSIAMTKMITEEASIVSDLDFDVGYMCIKVNNETEVNNIKSFIFSEYFLEHTRKWKELDGYGFAYALKYLPPFDISKSWTNNEVKEFIEGAV